MRISTTLLPLAALALLGGCDRQSATSPQAKPEQQAEAAPEPSGTLDISHRGETMPVVAFEAPDGDQVTLGDFRGKPLLVNLWATWCGPCKAEMASLDKLGVRQGEKLHVMVVSQDSDRKLVDDYMGSRKFAMLEAYLDKELKLNDAFATGVVPTTVLYDKDGKEIWRVVGAMDWDGPRANTLMAEALAG